MGLEMEQRVLLALTDTIDFPMLSSARSRRESFRSR